MTKITGLQGCNSQHVMRLLYYTRAVSLFFITYVSSSAFFLFLFLYLLGCHSRIITAPAAPYGFCIELQPTFFPSPINSRKETPLGEITKMAYRGSTLGKGRD